MENTYLAVDIETTGLSPVKDKIIEIGAVKVVNGEVCGTFSRLIDPQVALSQRIVALTNITDEMLFGQPTIQTVIKEFLEFAGNDPLLGHNILFDYSFLKTEAKKQGLEFERKGIDTLQIARVLHPELESRSLESLSHYYGIANESQHRAYTDALAAHELYWHLSRHSGATLDLTKARPLNYKVKKIEPMTAKQKNYLLDLVGYHKIELRQSLEELTKSEASRLIDRIIYEYGRMKS